MKDHVAPLLGSRFDSINGGGPRKVFYRQAVAPSPTQRKKDARQAPAPLIEFTSAAHEYFEQIADRSLTIGTSQQAFGPIEIKAFGYLRAVCLLVNVSGLTAGTAHEDAPFRTITDISLKDTNGGYLQHPVDGFDLFLENLYGSAVAFQQDPRLQPDYDGATPNFDFLLRVPVEILANNGFGGLGNQNASATYSLECTLNTIANVWSVAPTGTGTVRLRVGMECWTQPRATSLDGRLQAVMPPGHGTTQKWAKQILDANAGDNVLQIKPGMGNLIKNIIFISRADGAGARSTTNFPDPVELRWDSRQLLKEWKALRRQYMIERYIHSSAGIPTGVFVFDFEHDVLGHGGNGTPELWLATMQSTRFELVGTFGAAQDVTVLVNYVTPVETDQGERYDFESETRFEPAV